MSRITPAFYANLVAILMAVAALMAFVALPWVGARIPDIPAIPGVTPQIGGDYEATGAETIHYLHLWNTSADAIDAALQKVGLEFMDDLIAETGFTVRKIDYYILIALPVVLLGIVAASATAIAVPKSAEILRWVVLFCGAVIVSIALAWGYRMTALTFARVGFWTVVIAGIIIIVQSFVPRRVAVSAPAISASLFPAQPFASTQLPTLPPVPQPTPAPQPAPPPESMPLAAPAPVARPPVAKPRPGAPPGKYPTDAILINIATGQNYPLFYGNTTIGRSARNDIAIDAGTISREHALIQERNGQFILFDRASKHGTQVNGQTVTGPVLLQPDVTIVLGGATTLQFKRPAQLRS